MKKTLSILLVATAALTMAACNSKSKESTKESSVSQSSSKTQSAKKSTAETKYPVTIKTYDAEGKEIDQVFEKAPKKVITNNL